MSVVVVIVDDVADRLLSCRCVGILPLAFNSRINLSISVGTLSSELTEHDEYLTSHVKGKKSVETIHLHNLKSK